MSITTISAGAQGISSILKNPKTDTLKVDSLFSSLEMDSIISIKTIQDEALKDSLLTAYFEEISSDMDSLSLGLARTMIFNDSIPQRDSLANRTAQRIALVKAKDAPEEPITYGAQDTQWLEKASSRVHLYGDAYVNYENYEIKAGYIIFDFDKNEAYAEGITNPAGVEIQKPSFTDGTQNFTYNRLRYNFKSQKGIVYDAVTTEGEFFVHGARTKFVSSESDSLQFDDQIFNENALITTCNHPHPHYGIRARRLKVIPNKLAVVGPANLEIAGVSTPLWLPFGFFPIIKGVSNGLIFPQDYEYDSDIGFGLREVGYYFPINDYMDLKITGDIYTRGSYGLRLHSNYKKRYNYNGYLKIGYSDRRMENPETAVVESTKAFSIKLSHTQDSKAHPYRSLSGSIDFEKGSYRRNNFNDAGSQFENIYTSNMDYSYNFPDSPFKVSVGFSHKQNSTSGDVQVTFPELVLNMNTIKPFENKNRGSNPEKWYEKFSIRYDTRAKSFVKSTDSLIFTNQIWDDLQYGIAHEATASMALNVMKYFTLTPSMNYDEIWFFRTLERQLDPNNFRRDSTVIDIDIDGNNIYQFDTTYSSRDTFVDGFKPYRNFNLSAGLSTQLFGTKSFSSGWLRGIRHHVKPNVSLSYRPNTQDRYEQFYRTEFDNLLADSIAYNPFSGGVFGTPGLQGQTFALNYSIINIFEAKYFSKKDSTAKKLKLFNNINVNGSYNFAADSLKWSAVTISGNTQLFKGLTDFRFNIGLDPYIRDENNRAINTTVWSVKKRPLQFHKMSTSFVTRLTFKQIRDVFKGKDPGDIKDIDNNRIRGKEFEINPSLSEEEEAERILKGENNEEEQLELEKRKAQQTNILDLFDNFKINHTLKFMGDRLVTGKDSFYMQSNSISLQGSFDLTENWNIQIDRISYDFKNKALVYPSFTLSRNLHCWRMNFRWQPARGSYSFFIGVQSSALSFLKYNYGENNFSGF